MVQVVGMLLILTAIYGIIIAVFVRLIRNFRVVSSQAVFASFLTFGLAAGVLIMLLWPHDSSVLPNIYGVWLGDWVYRQAVASIGNPYSAQAHDTIPWVFRVPQVYVSTSIGLCASIGLLLQWLFDRYAKRFS